jgi:hypothetical protein
MKVLAIAAVLLLPLAANAGELQRCPSKMLGAVEHELLPVLDALRLASDKNDWFDPGYEKAFAHLLQSKSRASIEARVALMDYYIGESTGEELVCAVAADGSRASKLLQRYSRCDIAPSRSPMPRTRALPLRAYALQMLKEGHVKVSCTYE